MPHHTLTRTFVLALAGGTTLAAAQAFKMGGVGRFPCSTRSAAGVVTMDASQCTNAQMFANQRCPPDNTDLGSVNGGFKNNGFGEDLSQAGVADASGGLTSDSHFTVPPSADCVLDAPSGDYYCGLTGATCADHSNCDNGQCVAGVCVGGLGYDCARDSDCLGNIYCLGPSGATAGQCGDSGAGEDGALDASPETNFASVITGQDICSASTGTCMATVTPSQRARRRAMAFGGAVVPKPQKVCPAEYSACQISTRTDLEQCGACAKAGGVDCTALPGVEAVGCVAGRCEIWICAKGFVWSATDKVCSPAATE
ncbi:hypothetical protein RQP46_009637 [Phenoliferia psychrophenolica]